MDKKRNIFKCYSYFRSGYALYLAAGIGLTNVLTTSYFLAIQEVPFILEIFPTFYLYIATVIAIGTPIVITIGWLHFKRIGIFAAEVAIYAQVNPYNYKLAPGHNLEVFGPAFVQILNINRKKLLGEKLTEEEIVEIKRIERRLEKLIAGGYAGNPPKGAFK